MDDALRFSVMGENDDIFEGSVARHEDDSSNITAHCSCGAAQHGDFCLHRFEIFEGDISNLVSENLDDLQTLKDWIKGSDVEAAMDALSRARMDLKIAREKYAYARNMLARRMMD